MEDLPDAPEDQFCRPSSAPNSININRCTAAEVNSILEESEQFGEALLKYRSEHGLFKRVNDLMKVPGVNESVYRHLTGLRPKADLVAAERRINTILSIDEHSDYPLTHVIFYAQEKLKLRSLILSGRDGLELCSSGDKSYFESNNELLAAAVPQLFKKTSDFTEQARIPAPDSFTYFANDTAITFGNAGEVFLIVVYDKKFPEPEQVEACHQLIRELAWFCSKRAVV